jgi:hypothetical protein
MLGSATDVMWTNCEIKKAAEDDKRSMTDWIMIQVERAIEEVRADKPKRR